MDRSTIRRARALVALVGLAACSDGPTGPVCTPIVSAPTVIRFPIFAPGAVVPFAGAEVYLRFEPLGSYFVAFRYRLDYASDNTTWFFVGRAGFNGAVVPTNEVLVSTDPDPIELGSAQLTFQSFTPF